MTAAPAASTIELPAATSSPVPPAPAATVALGARESAEVLGVSLQPLVGFSFVIESDRVVLAEPGFSEDPFSRARLVLSGGLNTSGFTTERLYSDFATALRERGGAISEPVRAEIDERPALVADLRLTEASGDAEANVGRIVFVATQRRGFTMLGQAPESQWQAETSRRFDAVLNSIRFINIEDDIEDR